MALAAIAVLVALLLYLQGTIGWRRVAPGVVEPPAGGSPQGRTAASHALAVEQREVDDLVDWPGTVSSRTVANVAPKMMARVLEVRVAAGAAVKAGDVIATLDDRELRARAEQARGALTAAGAQATQADADQWRIRMLFQNQAATQQDLDAVQARAQAARAQVAQARDGLAEVEVLLGDTSVRAPFDGIVASRLADPGDMAAPGKPLAVIHDPRSLRLEVQVSERCAGGVSAGMEAPAHLDVLGRDVVVRIEEIAPVADPQSRTFLVKAALPDQPGVRPGTFGSLRAACGKHMALLIPPAAVTRTGQLESVSLVAEGQIRTRHIRTGKIYGDRVEVLSGLAPGEQVLAEAGARPPDPR